MAKNRKTETDRRLEREDAARKTKDKLFVKIAAISTNEEIIEIEKSAPGPGKPGRESYSNFLFFIKNKIIPGSSYYDEWKLYLSIIDKLTEIGLFDSTKSENLKAELQRKIDGY